MVLKDSDMGRMYIALGLDETDVEAIKHNGNLKYVALRSLI